MLPRRRRRRNETRPVCISIAAPFSFSFTFQHSRKREHIGRTLLLMVSPGPTLTKKKNDKSELRRSVVGGHAARKSEERDSLALLSPPLFPANASQGRRVLPGPPRENVTQSGKNKSEGLLLLLLAILRHERRWTLGLRRGGGGLGLHK